MPLAHAGDAPFPRPALETMLLDGDLENAHGGAGDLGIAEAQQRAHLLGAQRGQGGVLSDARRADHEHAGGLRGVVLGHSIAALMSCAMI